MPRNVLIRSDVHTYHVTARTNDKQFYPIEMNEVWKIFIDELKNVQERFGICIHAFVLMDNHFHLLVQTPRCNLDQVMHLLMRNTAVKIMRKADGTNHLWGGRYKWSLIESHAYYYQVYRYIYQNPLRARMVERVEFYPYSTLTSRVPFPLHSRVNLEMWGDAAELIWLNERIDNEGEAIIRKGLRRWQFDINKKKIKLFETLKRPKGE